MLTSESQRARLKMPEKFHWLRCHCGTRVCSIDQCQDKCATYVLDLRQIRKLFGQDALRKHTSESVLGVSELLCTGVQGNTQEHKQGNAREMCSCWETVNKVNFRLRGDRQG